jgi:hypothetical protein
MTNYFVSMRMAAQPGLATTPLKTWASGNAQQERQNSRVLPYGESAATFLRLTWRAMMGTTAAITYVDAYTRQTQAAALYADSQHGNQQ